MNFIFNASDKYDDLLKHELTRANHANVFHIPRWHRYQKYYLGNRLVKDLSFFLIDDSKVSVAFVPLFLCQHEQQLEFSYGGDYLEAPLFFIPETMNTRSSIESVVFEKVDELARQEKAVFHRLAINSFEVIKGFTQCNYLRKYEYQDQSTASQVIDLSQSLESLWQATRKSYRPLINQARKRYQHVVIDIDHPDHSSFEEYRKLHYAAAGRQTRPIETFQLMYEIICSGNAFLVGVTDSENRWVGTFYFLRFHGHVFYGSSARHPDIASNSGIGHLGLWLAIEYAKSIGDQAFELGQQPFPDDPEFNEKENNIAMFKRGFGGKCITWFRGVKHFHA